jgi:hypothetical protein
VFQKIEEPGTAWASKRRRDSMEKERLERILSGINQIQTEGNGRPGH